jgi:serine/threonine-protein kinase RsbW
MDPTADGVGDALAEPAFSELISLESSLENLPELLLWFKSFNRLPLPTPIWIQGQTGLMEAFSNAVRHAHRGLVPPPKVGVAVNLAPEGIQIKVIDGGPPYDFDAALEAVEAIVTAPGFNPLDREAHWGQVLLLRLRDYHGWSISYGPCPDGGNQFCLTRPLGDGSVQMAQRPDPED